MAMSSFWVWVVILAAVIKLPMAALMLWIPYRRDEAMRAETESGDSSSEEDGGSKALPGGPLDPHPRAPRPPRPRRGPHGSPDPSSPPRVRTRATSTRPLRARPLRATRHG